VGIVNVELISSADGLETLEWRAERDYLLQGVSVQAPDTPFVELEISSTNTRRSGVGLNAKGWSYPNDQLIWSGYRILVEGSFVLAHVDLMDTSGALVTLRIDVIAVSLPAFKVVRT